MPFFRHGGRPAHIRVHTHVTVARVCAVKASLSEQRRGLPSDVVHANGWRHTRVAAVGNVAP